MSWAMIPAIETKPHWVSAVQHPLGRVPLFAGCALCLLLLGVPWKAWLIGLLGLVIFLPAWRQLWILAGTVCGWVWVSSRVRWYPLEEMLQGAGLTENTWFSPQSTARLLELALLALVVLGCYGVLRWVHRQPRSGGRRPMRWVLVGGFSLLFGISYLPMPEAVRTLGWGALLIASGFFGYLCYGVMDRDRCSVPLWRQLSVYLPLWMPTPIPYPKGPQYLFSREATDPLALAVCQLKGLKLLVWAVVLLQVRGLFDTFFYGRGSLAGELIQLSRVEGSLLLQLPLLKWQLATGLALPVEVSPLAQSVPMYASGVPLGTATLWTSFVADFLRELLRVAFWGHTLIGVVRVLGFNVFRNTYRPLQARSIADFYGRYEYYFKEFLFNLIYFPLLLRLKGVPVWLRNYLALLVTMLLGNFGLHVYLENLFAVSRVGVLEAVTYFEVFLFYCLVLATGIFFSQMNPQRRVIRSGARLWINRVGILLFFAVLNLFGDPLTRVDLAGHFKYLGGLLGLS